MDELQAAVCRARQIRMERQRELRALAEQAAHRLATCPLVDKVILFGSVAQGWAHRDSDVDLAVVARIPADVPPHRRLEYLGVDVSLGRGVDVLVYTPQEFTIAMRESSFVREEIVGKGMILYERISHGQGLA